MKYFCKVRLESGKDSETTLFLILDAVDGDVPQPDKQLITESREYRLFTQGKHAKLVVAEYSVYSTELDITANLENERFERMIETGEAEIVSTGEMQIARNEKHDKSGTVIRKRSFPKWLVPVIIGGAAVFSMVAFSVGKNFGRNTAVTEMQTESLNVAEDGLIIPKQDAVPDNAEQITITIDRSKTADT